jgi:transposase
VRGDAVCGRLMTAPGVGPVVAVTYKTAIDDPTRFRKSKDVGLRRLSISCQSSTPNGAANFMSSQIKMI